MVQERRGLLRVWNLSLLVAAFSLTILGTFLTRSGVLVSVHSFSNSTIGPVLLGLLRPRRRGRRGADRLAWRPAALARDDRRGRLARRRLPRQQPAVRRLRARRAARDRLPAFRRGAERPAGHRRAAVLRHDDAPDRSRAAVLHGGGAGPPVAQGGPRRAPPPPRRARRGSVPASSWCCVLAGVRGFTPLLAFGLGGFAGASAAPPARALGGSCPRRAGAGAWRALFGRANGGMIVHLGVVVVAVALAAASSYGRADPARAEAGPIRPLRRPHASPTSARPGSAFPTRAARSPRSSSTARPSTRPSACSQGARASARRRWIRRSRDDTYLTAATSPFLAHGAVDDRGRHPADGDVALGRRSDHRLRSRAGGDPDWRRRSAAAPAERPSARVGGLGDKRAGAKGAWRPNGGGGARAGGDWRRRRASERGSPVPAEPSHQPAPVGAGSGT